MPEKTLSVSLLEKFVDDREKIVRYSAIAELCPIPVFIVASDGLTTVYVNPAYQEFTGRSLAELQHGEWLNVIAPEDHDRALKFWKEFTLTNVPAPIFLRYQCKFGIIREGTATTYRVEMNGYVGFIVPKCQTDCFLLKMVSPAGISPATVTLGP